MTPRMTPRPATTERLRRLVAASAFAALCGFSTPAVPCGAFVARNVKTVPSLSVEQTLIVFDEQKQLEHFVRQVVIRDPSPGFGFVVPTPERPEVASIEHSPFEKLARQFPVSSGLRISPGARGGGAGSGAPAAAVTVLSKERVGSFTAFVLAATDAAALQKWLKDNRFSVEPVLQDWLNHYVKLSFYFTALRYEAPQDKPAAGVTSAETLRISFHTPLPYYPYREPLHVHRPEPRELAVWLIAARRYVPVSLSNEVPGGRWKRPWLEHSQRDEPRADLAELLGEPLAKLLPQAAKAGEPATLQVQVFEDQKRDRRAYGDVVLVPSEPVPRNDERLKAAGKLMKSLDPRYEAP
jgi:hypothetical protein